MHTRLHNYGDYVNKWTNELVKWVDKWVSEVSEVSEWVSDQVSEWVSDRVSGWVWVSELVKWAGEWLLH